MGVYTTAAKTWGAEPLKSSDLNAQVRDLINGFSAWTTYTPTMTGFTLGNGTITGKYTQIQKHVEFWALFTFGTTSAAAAAAPTLSLPVTALTANRGMFIGQFNSGSATYNAVTFGNATTSVQLWVPGTNGVYTSPTTTVPFTWNSASYVYVSGVYEAA